MPDMLIDYYKAIEASSRSMLEAAKAQDWEQVVRFEGACAVLIAYGIHEALEGAELVKHASCVMGISCPKHAAAAAAEF